MSIPRKLPAFVALAVALARSASGAEPSSPDDEARFQANVAEFTRKMKAANYPALFEQAAREFNVPADILKGIAFAETRWEHLTWPAGETASPDTGMPRPYGIMSLWDNRYFGHSLLQAAQLIGKDPEELKRDPLHNIRGAAALLRKLYDENPKPAESTQAELESWRSAIRKYCGIPEPDLNAQHALDVYVFISRGYHQYGIEWNARPVKLEPIRQDTARIVAEARARRLAALGTNSHLPTTPPPVLAASAMTEAESRSNQIRRRGPAPHPRSAVSPPPAASPQTTAWFIAGALATIAAVYLFSRQKSPPPK